MKQRIDVLNPEDRQQVAAILVKNGYTVRLGREKNGKSRTTIFVEFWRDSDEQNTCVN